MNENKTNINWYPGHMAKTKNEIKGIISSIDIVLEVVDARIPFSSSIKDLNTFINNKKTITIFSKYDLCDKNETLKWKNYFEKNNKKVLLIDLKNNSDYKKIIKELENSMKDVNEKRKNKGMLPKKIKVLVVGMPNVGKSTLINKISGKKKVNVENRPGVTKHLSWIKVKDNIELMDSPGILMPKIESEEVALNLASMTTIKETVLPLDRVSIHILNKLNLYYKDKLKEYYNIDNYDENNIINMYEIISKFRNIKYIGDKPDYDRINLVIVNDIKSERIKEITFDKM